jgi:hypothetical protein
MCRTPVVLYKVKNYILRHVCVYLLLCTPSTMRLSYGSFSLTTPTPIPFPHINRFLILFMAYVADLLTPADANPFIVCSNAV